MLYGENIVLGEMVSKATLPKGASIFWKDVCGKIECGWLLQLLSVIVVANMNVHDEVENCRKFVSTYKNIGDLIFELLGMPHDENNLIILSMRNVARTWFWAFYENFGIYDLLHRNNAQPYATKICNTKSYLQWNGKIRTKTITKLYMCKSEISYCKFAYGMFLTKNNIRNFAIFIIQHMFHGSNGYCKYRQTFRKFLDILPPIHINSPKTFYELMHDYITHHPNTTEMHNWLSTYKPYRKYVRNFPPLKVRVCAIYEQSIDAVCNKKRKRWSVVELVFMDEYLVKCVCDMLDISRD
jgi:hypothetical protein